MAFLRSPLGIMKNVEMKASRGGNDRAGALDTVLVRSVCKGESVAGDFAGPTKPELRIR